MANSRRRHHKEAHCYMLYSMLPQGYHQFIRLNNNHRDVVYVKVSSSSILQTNGKSNVSATTLVLTSIHDLRVLLYCTWYQIRCEYRLWLYGIRSYNHHTICIVTFVRSSAWDLDLNLSRPSQWLCDYISCNFNNVYEHCELRKQAQRGKGSHISNLSWRRSSLDTSYMLFLKHKRVSNFYPLVTDSIEYKQLLEDLPCFFKDIYLHGILVGCNGKVVQGTTEWYKMTHKEMMPLTEKPPMVRAKTQLLHLPKSKAVDVLFQDVRLKVSTGFFFNKREYLHGKGLFQFICFLFQITRFFEQNVQEV